MSDVSPGSAPNTNQQYTDAIESYRSIAKWVISTFGAVAAAFVVGLSLNTLGGLAGWRVAMSIVCIIVGFGAVAFTIAAATAVLEPLRVTFGGFEKSPDFGPLRRLLAEDQSPLDDEATTAQGLAAKLKEFEEHEEVARKFADEHPENPVAAQRVRDRQRDVDYLYEKVSGLALLGQMLRVKDKYLASKKKVSAAVVVAGLAAIGFAFASNPPHQETPSAAQATVKPQVHVSVGGPRLLDWPRSCARLYFALDKLAAAEPRVGPLWPAGSLSDWDRACGLRSRADVARAPGVPRTSLAFALGDRQQGPTFGAGAAQLSARVGATRCSRLESSMKKNRWARNGARSPTDPSRSPRSPISRKPLETVPHVAQRDPGSGS